MPIYYIIIIIIIIIIITEGIFVVSSIGIILFACYIKLCKDEHWLWNG